MTVPAIPGTTGPADAPAADIPAQMNPSPANMPGADKAIPPATQTVPAKADDKPVAPAATDANGDGETVEIGRFKAVQKIARDLEKTAKDNKSDADAYRKIMAALGGEGGEEAAPADPMKAIADLRTELSSERTERLREKIAHDTGVPISQVSGADEETMKATAEAANTWAQAKVNELLKQAGVPLAAPAANVTSTDVPGAQSTQQIQSRDQLKTMTPQQITAAYKEGRMDKLLGK